MTLQLPTLLALLGAALMAVAIFVPQKPFVRVMARPALIAHATIATWHEAPLSDTPVQTLDAPLLWPALIDARATHCDAPARAEIVRALGALGEDWCGPILRRALDEETDAGVRLALMQALNVS
jgi:hypothetical protein